MAKQLNVFVENRPGRLRSITETLCESGINIISFTTQDRGDFGLLKLIVNRPQDAKLALAEKGFACALKDILAISIKDSPGNLHKLTSILEDHNVNVIDASGYVIEPEHRGICCMEIEDMHIERIEKFVEEAGFKILEDEELYEL